LNDFYLLNKKTRSIISSSNFLIKKSVLFLLPEINLTPQFLKTFETYLNVPIYSYNSTINNSDKFGLWKLLQEDDSPKLILGVRSSVFIPIKNLSSKPLGQKILDY
jgi:primosomal protein N'